MKSPRRKKARVPSNLRKKQSTQTIVNYDSLEPRQMLATDLGLNLIGATLGNESDDPVADVTGDASSDFVVQAVNGHFGVYDRTEGLRVQSSSLEDFFESTGATLFDDLTNPQVMFDHGTQRWFAAAQGEGAGNWIHVAFSDTSDPTGTWQQLQFVGDSTGTHYNDDLIMSIDSDAIYLSTNNHLFGNVTALPDNVSLYSIPKADAFLDDPTLTNMSRFEELDPAVVGVSIQVASNFEASDGSAIAIGKTPWEFTGTASITRTDIIGADAAGATLSVSERISLEPEPLDPIYGPARNPFQPGSTFATKDNYRVNVAEANGTLFGVQTVSLDDKDDDTPNRNVVHWFELDIATNQIVESDSRIGGGAPWQQSQHITTPLGDAFNASLDVNDNGLIAISYNTSGDTATDEGIDRFIAFNTTVGITVNGISHRSTQMENTVTIQAGLDDYPVPPLPSRWGDYGTTRLDPSNTNSFWGFQSWANTTNRWSAQLTHLNPVDMRVIVEANDDDNEIILRRTAADPGLFEIEIDGVVTDTFAYSVVDTIELRGYGGNDNFLIDYTNGDPISDNGLVLDGGFGTDTLRTNSVDGVEYLVNQFGGGTYNTASQFRGMEELFGWTGDDLFRFEGFGSIAGSANGLEGNDTFEFADNGSVGNSVNGGSGYNTLSLFERARSTVVELVAFGTDAGYDGRTVGTGPIGGGDATDQFRDIGNLIGGQIGNDQITGLNQMDASWFIDDENSFYELGGVVMDFSFWDVINGNEFDDTFNVRSNSLDPLTLNGFDGADTYNFSSDAPNNTGIIHGVGGLIFANAGSGENVMVVSNELGTSTDALVLSQRITGMGEIVYESAGGTFDITIIGSADNDTFSLHSFLPGNTLVVESRAGDDFFSIQDLSKADVTVKGQEGDDTYTVEMIQGVSFRNLKVIDSIDLENDRVLLIGTVLDEVFNITDTTFSDLEVEYTGIEAFGVEAGAGNDIINVLSSNLTLTLNGEEGDDIFNFASDAPNNMGDLSLITGDVMIEGGSGTNQINLINQTGTGLVGEISGREITGLLGNGSVIQYTATDGDFNFREADGFGGIRLVGSELETDQITVTDFLDSNWLSIIGLGGNDVFSVRPSAAGTIWLAGSTGDDQYNVFAGNQLRTINIVDSTPGDANRFEYFGSANDDIMMITAAVISSANDLINVDAEFSFLRVNGLAGNDELTIDTSPAIFNHFLGGDDNDLLTILNSTGITGLRGVGGDGDDIFNLTDVLSSTFTRAVGGDGNDTFNLSSAARGGAALNGQMGDDTYNVGLLPIGRRFVDTRDTGVGGQDVTNVIGTTFIDPVEIRSTRIISNDQTIAFSRNTEQIDVQTGDGNDTIDVFASVAGETIIRMGGGEDTLLVTATAQAASLKIFGGANADTITVKSTNATTATELHGDGGGDKFIIGSSVSKDNGNLGRIRGSIFVQADNDTKSSQGDWLFVNDAGVNGGYSYSINPTSIESIPGPRNVPRPQFAGIAFDGSLEGLRLDGTQLGNHFSVTPSMTTRYKFDGNDPNSSPVNGDSITIESGGGTLTVSNIRLGNGHWDFASGFQRVEFRNMEIWGNGGPMPLVGSDLDEGDRGTSPLMMTLVEPTNSVELSALAGMQESIDSDIDSEEDRKMKKLRALDNSVKNFDFELELI